MSAELHIEADLPREDRMLMWADEIQSDRLEMVDYITKSVVDKIKSEGRFLWLFVDSYKVEISKTLSLRCEAAPEDINDPARQMGVVTTNPDFQPAYIVEHYVAGVEDRGILTHAFASYNITERKLMTDQIFDAGPGRVSAKMTCGSEDLNAIESWLFRIQDILDKRINKPLDDLAERIITKIKTQGKEDPDNPQNHLNQRLIADPRPYMQPGSCRSVVISDVLTISRVENPYSLRENGEKVMACEQGNTIHAAIHAPQSESLPGMPYYVGTRYDVDGKGVCQHQWMNKDRNRKDYAKDIKSMQGVWNQSRCDLLIKSEREQSAVLDWLSRVEKLIDAKIEESGKT